jgi:DNA ligase-1
MEWTDGSDWVVLNESINELNAPRWISEKLDGIRAYWDGNKLYFRSKKEIAIPEEISLKFPKLELDIELW